MVCACIINSSRLRMESVWGEVPGPSHPYSSERRADSLPLLERIFRKDENIRDTGEIRYLHLLAQVVLHIRSSHLGIDQADLHRYRLVAVQLNSPLSLVPHRKISCWHRSPRPGTCSKPLSCPSGSRLHLLP